MAEAILLSLASTILSTAASALPAREWSSLIWGPEKELQRLEGTMKTIKARLDAVLKRGSSIAAADAVIVKDWMERIGDVLHEADDLFDEVAANKLLKEPMGENKLLKEVKVSLSNLNAPSSNYSILEKIKDIRERFEDIEKVVAFPNLLQLQPEEPLRAGIVGAGPFINPQEIVGREGDLQALRDFLLGYTTGEDTVPVIAIVGMGGIGKTTLAQLICGDTAVNTKFEKIWWADVPAEYTEADVLSRIFQSIEKKSYGGEPSQLRARVSELVTKTKADPGNYLLILDGVQDQRGFKWCDIIGLLSTGAKGSRIIVTTRYKLVANAMHAAKTFNLEGLSVSSSKKLFDRIAIGPSVPYDGKREQLGEKIRERCANNPLVIKSIATLLSSDPEIQHWQSVSVNPNLLDEGGDSIISRLRLTYDHLKPEVKPCFAYCALFPKRHTIVKEELIDLWIAQGYVKKPEGDGTLHSVGNGYFRELVAFNFFQELKMDKQGDIISCQIHDLYHQLAKDVAGGQSVILTEQFDHFTRRIRHLAVGYQRVDTWTIPKQLLAAERLRSSLFVCSGSLTAPVVDTLVRKFKFLRALDLEDLKVDTVSESVGALKHLRYLNLSRNTFTSLPSSLSKLVNLQTLDISHCEQLKALPDDFHMLINLRVLNAEQCCCLLRLPPGFKELTSLEYLSYFYVGELRSEGRRISRGLKKLMLRKGAGTDHQLPKNVRVLKIENPTDRMPYWADIHSLFSKLEKLHIFNSQAVKVLPSLRCLASLQELQLSNLGQLEYIEESDGSTQSADASSTSSFFPSLESLTLYNLPNLREWLKQSGRISAENQMPQFTTLFTLRIEDCMGLSSIPLSGFLETLELRCVNEKVQKPLLSASNHLRSLTIWGNREDYFEFQSLTWLRYLELVRCPSVVRLDLAPAEHSVLEELQIEDCPLLGTYGLKEDAILDWDSFPKLQLLTLDKEKMPRDYCQPILIEREESQD